MGGTFPLVASRFRAPDRNPLIPLRDQGICTISALADYI